MSGPKRDFPAPSTRPGPFLLLPLILVLATAPVRGDDAASLSEAGRKALAGMAVDLADAGEGTAAASVVGILAATGCPERFCESIAGRCGRAAKRAKNARRRAEVLREAQATVAQIAKELESLAGEARTDLAEILLSLDEDQPEARRVLGWTLANKRWVRKQDAAGASRRAACRNAIQEASDLALEVKTIPPDDLLAGIGASPAAAFRCGSYEIHGTVTPHRLRYALEQGLRATAVARYVLDGRESLLDAHPIQKTFLVVSNRPQYEEVIARARKRGWIDRETLDAASVTAGVPLDAPNRNIYLQIALTAPELAAIFATYVSRLSLIEREPFGACQPCLHLGILDVACWDFLGTAGARFLAREPFSRAGPSDESWFEAALREAGTEGHRRRLRLLAERDQDPPWVRSMQADPGLITGDERLKAASVVRFLSERGNLLPLVLVTMPTHADVIGREVAEVFAGALGRPLPEIEKEWKAWLLGEEDPYLGKSVLGRAGASREAVLSGDLARATDYLNGIRVRAGVDEIRGDRELSRGALLHAEYLTLNPMQATAWPDAHEEYRGREGFSPEGAWAGAHSVVYPEVSEPDAAIDGWMATYYHRLPLLDPGLLSIGWGTDGRNGVLDAGSIVMECRYDVRVCWPPDGARDVPLSFAPELPNPVPGEDQSAWGYPVTVQLWWTFGEDEPVVRLSLCVSGKDGAPVECYFSTPTDPSNPSAVPPHAWCLIPKRRLRPGTDYTVEVRTAVGAVEKTSSFHFRTVER